jgi:hypothetical protein
MLKSFCGADDGSLSQRIRKKGWHRTRRQGTEGRLDTIDLCKLGNFAYLSRSANIATDCVQAHFESAAEDVKPAKKQRLK